MQKLPSSLCGIFCAAALLLSFACAAPSGKTSAPPLSAPGPWAGMWTTTYGGEMRLSYLGALKIQHGIRSNATFQMLVHERDKPPMQQFDGFGAALSGSSAYLLTEFKSSHEALYWQLLQLFFNASVENGAG